MKYWVVTDAVPVKEAPGAGKVMVWLSLGDIIEIVNPVEEVPSLFNRVKLGENRYGWVYQGYIEPYISDQEGVVKIQNATATELDANQYLIWKGKTQYNLCGFFCACMVANWDAYIEDFLTLLEAKKPSLIQRVFPKWQGKGTAAEDLMSMLTILDIPHEKIQKQFFDTVAGRTILSPKRYADILERNKIIYSVRINKQTGKVVKSGTLHWIILLSIEVFDYGGLFTVYNPFGNRIEKYTYEQIVESGGVPYGVIC